MNPTPNSVHIDQALTNISTAYFQDQAGYVANKVFPIVPVGNQTNKYFTFDKNDTLRDKAAIRPPNTESEGGGFRVSTDSYSCDVFAWHVDLNDQQLANADAGLDLERGAARVCVDAILRQLEADWAATCFASSVWGIDLTGGSNFTKWDNYATSTPLEDVEAQRLAILKGSAKRPNTLVLGATVYSKLKNHPDFVDRIKFVSDSVVTREIMARLFEVDNLYVAEAVAATNIEGETAAYDFLLGKHAWLGYVTNTPSMMEATAGYVFAWDEVSNGTGVNVGTSIIPMPLKRAQRVEAQLSWDVKVVATDLGAFFGSAVN